MNLKTVLLGFLTQGEMTGYELKDLMGKSVGFFFGASYGSIYPALKGLEAEGSVVVDLVIQSGRPNKKVYAITPEGRERLRDALDEPLVGDSFRSEFLMRLFFGHMQDPEDLLGMIRDRRAGHEETVRRLEGVREEFADVATPYQIMCLRSGIFTSESYIRFLDEIEGEISALASGREEAADVGA